MKVWKSKLFLFLVFLLAAIIIGRLFYLQILNYKFYQSQALGQQAGFSQTKGSRGEIFLSNSGGSHGNYSSSQIKSLAINKDEWLLSSTPSKIEDKEVFADELSNAIGETKESILSKINSSDSYIVLKKDLSQGEVDSINNLDLKGLTLENNPGRYYPQEDSLSQMIGFVGGDDNGQYGIEGYYNDILNGQEGIMEAKSGFDSIGDSFSYLNGSDLYLTIDYNIQFEAESLLEEAKKNINIDSGQIIVLNPHSGRVLALANFPNFNPNAYSKETNFDIFQNATVQKIFEPGSIFKPFTMGMALEEGKVTPETRFVDTGSVKIGPDTVYNFDHKKYGDQDMSGILEKSINVGAVFLSQKLSHQTFIDYLEKLGLNDKTGIDLQGEVASRNEVLKNGSDFGFATASFGQGIEMTPMQLISAFSIFANGGKMVKPYVVDKIIHDEEEQDASPQTGRQVISEKTASEVTTMMTNVVNRGFGSGAKVPGYYLAGKTGTAQVPIPGKLGYDKNKTIQSFIGFGPALKPEFLILVKLDNPKVPQSSLSAAPIFKKLAQYIINYWQIPPDY